MTGNRPSTAPSTGQRTGPRSDRVPTCPLETLNVDCILVILSEVNSLADLAAFIHASTTVLACFLSAKASILVRVLTHELGPAIRDAFVLSYTYNLDMFSAGTFEQTLDIAVGGYRECLLATTGPWIPSQDPVPGSRDRRRHGKAHQHRPLFHQPLHPSTDPTLQPRPRLPS